MSYLHNLPIADFYQGRILNFAHRGAQQKTPENTIPAFQMAADLGADGVELDVQLSADYVPVVIHDPHVDTTTDGAGLVAQKTLVELRELDAGSWFAAEFVGTPIPTLEEVFESVGERLLFNIELKDFSINPRLAEIVLALIQNHDIVPRTLISSFNPFILRHVRRLAPQIPVGYLYAPDLPLPLAKGWLARPVIGWHEARHPHFSMVDEHYMHWARRYNYRVNVWTVNELDDIRRMRDLGVDMIISNYPDLVQDVLQGEC